MDNGLKDVNAAKILQIIELNQILNSLFLNVILIKPFILTCFRVDVVNIFHCKLITCTGFSGTTK